MMMMMTDNNRDDDDDDDRDRRLYDKKNGLVDKKVETVHGRGSQGRLC